MKTRLVLATALALALPLGGCRDNDASVEIFAICAPPDDAKKCGTSGSCSSLLASPRLFAYTSVGGVVNQLEAFIEFRNQLPDNTDLELGRLNTNDFIGEDYLLSFSGVAGLSDVIFPANFTVPADSSSTPVVTLIPQVTMAQLSTALAAGQTALVVVELRARGHLVDGSQIETGPYEVAVEVIDASYTPIGCTTAGDVRFYCPNIGQTASTTCATP
jgi:hypothetical protein